MGNDLRDMAMNEMAALRAQLEACQAREAGLRESAAPLLKIAELFQLYQASKDQPEWDAYAEALEALDVERVRAALDASPEPVLLGELRALRGLEKAARAALQGEPTDASGKFNPINQARFFALNDALAAVERAREGKDG